MAPRGDRGLRHAHEPHVRRSLTESGGELSHATRRELAAEAFSHTAGYDIAIANWFLDAESFPDRRLLEFVKVAGARPIVCDLSARRLEFCRRAMGVADTVQLTGDGAELDRLRELTGGNLAEVVIDATGSNQSMGKALEYVAFLNILLNIRHGWPWQTGWKLLGPTG